MNAKHTPGPWRVIATGCIADKTQVIAQTVLLQDMEVSQANAILMSTAPDLLAALELLVYRVDNPLEFGGEEALTHRMNAARAAIAKARGE